MAFSMTIFFINVPLGDIFKLRVSFGAIIISDKIIIYRVRPKQMSRYLQLQG